MSGDAWTISPVYAHEASPVNPVSVASPVSIRTLGRAQHNMFWIDWKSEYHGQVTDHLPSYTA